MNAQVTPDPAWTVSECHWRLAKLVKAACLEIKPSDPRKVLERLAATAPAELAGVAIYSSWQEWDDIARAAETGGQYVADLERWALLLARAQKEHGVPKNVDLSPLLLDRPLQPALVERVADRLRAGRPPDIRGVSSDGGYARLFDFRHREVLSDEQYLAIEVPHAVAAAHVEAARAQVAESRSA